MNRKKFLLTAVLPIAVSLVIGAVIIILNNNYILNSRAAALIGGEKAKMNEEISQMNAEKNELSEKNEEYDKILADNEKLISELDTLQTELDNYTSDITAAEERNSAIDTQIAEKNDYLSSLSALTNETPGEKKTLKSGEYKCPSGLKAGRYKAEGEGTIYVYTISNSLRLKENLTTLDSHSYTFEINSGETLKTEGNISLTELLENSTNGN